MGNKSWYSVNKRGDNCLEYRPYVDLQWLSPFSHDAREYVKSNISKIASIEASLLHIWITLDFVTFIYQTTSKFYKINQDHEMPEYDFGYHPDGRSGFKEKFGIDPLDINGGELVQEWKQFRLDAVSSIVKELKALAMKKIKNISGCFPVSKNVKQNGATRLVTLGSRYNMSNELSCILRRDINWIGY